MLGTRSIENPDQMHELGLELGKALRAGDVLVLTGPLGAGKTTLTRGIGEGLGVRGPVTSPTFVLARTHPSLGEGPPLVHVDAYRLVDSENPNLYLDDLDLDVANSITFIEWGGAESARLSEDRLEITIDRSNDERTVEITPIGSRWAGFSL